MAGRFRNAEKEIRCGVLDNNQSQLQQADGVYSSEVRTAVIKKALVDWKKSPTRIALFKQMALDERNQLVRLAAVETLLGECQNDQTILEFLKNLFLNESCEAVKLRLVHRHDKSLQSRALIELIALFDQKSDEAITAILKKRTRPDIFKSFRDGQLLLETEESVPYKHRIAYILRVSRERKDEPDTLAWLKERAEIALCPLVRQRALEEVARCWATAPGALAWLKEREINHENNDVRAAACQEIAQRFTNDPEVWSWLKD